MDRPVPLVAVVERRARCSRPWGTGERYGRQDRAGRPGGECRDLDRSERSGLVLVWLVLVAAVVNLKRSMAKVGLPDLGKIAAANGCVLVHPPRPPVDASIGLAAQLRPSRGSCRGVVEAP
jgi:hypothetical protein